MARPKSAEVVDEPDAKTRAHAAGQTPAVEAEQARAEQGPGPSQAQEATGPEPGEYTGLARDLHDALVRVEQRFAQIPLVASLRHPSEEDLAEIERLIGEAGDKLKRLKKAGR